MQDIVSVTKHEPSRGMSGNIPTTPLLEVIFSKENMMRAASKVGQKKSAGIDGIPANEIKGYIRLHYTEIVQSIISGNYHPGKVLMKKIPKGNGKLRTITIANALDRVIMRCIGECLDSLFDNDMSDYSYGFRKGRNCEMEIRQIKRYCEQGFRYAVQIDLRDCFNHIDHDRILYLIRQKVNNPILLEMVKDYLKVVYVDGKTESVSQCGAAQGFNMSPLYANLVLDRLDKELERRGHCFVRYADDICVMCRSRAAAEKVKESIASFIEKKCKLLVNLEKSRIDDVRKGFHILGFTLYETSGVIHIVPMASKVEEIRFRVKEIIREEKPEDVVQRLNETVSGWAEYYKIAEAGRVTKDLDALVRREVNNRNKNNNINIINNKGIINFNKRWKEHRHPL